MQASPLAATPSAADVAFFESKVRPLLVKRCYECHSQESGKSKGGLLLDSMPGWQKGGENGEVIVPGEPDRSLLIKAVHYADENLQMPPKHKLADHEIAILSQWVKLGAPDPRVTEPSVKSVKKNIDIEAGRKFWAFQPVRKSAPPLIKDASWVRSDVDRFVLAELEKQNLKPVRDADKHALLRRATFDLTGLPPTPEEVDAFLADTSSGAFATVVDRLLKSPRFGERWGRHWLDVARYAESNGRDQNAAYPHAWRYRDYVIDAFNADKPYDRFITEQIAGDLLPSSSREQHDAQIVATGFLAIGPKLLFERDAERFYLDIADEQLATTSVAFLGLTVGCARCHDHKFDPVPTQDYYALAGIFRSADVKMGLPIYSERQRLSPLVPLGAEGEKLAKAYEAHEEKVRQAQRNLITPRNELRRLPESERKGTKAAEFQAQIDAAQHEIDTVSKQAPPAPDYAMAVMDRAQPIDCRVLIGGEVDSPAAVAPRGFLQVLPAGPKIGPNSSGRLELAQWLTSAENPLTARVMVNRVWHHLFGRGLVETVDNFGTTGMAPSHPQLLDFLAARFREDVWSVKHLIRSLMLSHVYQLSSEPDEKNQAVDPDNVWLWRMSQRRLEAEALRDAILAISGKLEFKRPEPAFNQRSSNSNKGSIFSPYRTVYLPNGRDAVGGFQQTFDFAEPSAVAGQRNVTTVPAQALFFMNSFFVWQHARFLAERTAKITDPARRMDHIFMLAYGRPPSAQERESAQKFFQDMTQEGRRYEPWSLFCQAIFAGAEFRYLR